jgi:hypothetical protein
LRGLALEWDAQNKRILKEELGLSDVHIDGMSGVAAVGSVLGDTAGNDDNFELVEGLGTALGSTDGTMEIKELVFSDR